MSEVFYWRYRLKLAGGGERLNARTPGAEIEGALLRHADGGVACLQPWATLGQGSLDGSLALLEAGGDSALLRSCRRCMALDGAARAAGVGLFEGKTVPRSHLSVPGWAEFSWLEEKFSSGFSTFKLKCGPDLQVELQRVRDLLARFGERLRLRLDFNECLDPQGVRRLVDLLGDAVAAIDFIEDPVPYDCEIWQALSAELPVDLAVDRAGSQAGAGAAVRVLKPAWEEVLQDPLRTVVTSAMDHPIGQLFAAYEASLFDGDLDECGLLTHWMFEANAFSEALEVSDRRLVPPGGAGLGFGDQLEMLPWKALKCD